MRDPQVDDRINSYLKTTVAKDLFMLIMGQHLGSGAARTVVRNDLNSHQVLKFETEGTFFQNVMEWKVWQSVQGTKWEPWFAPCVAISPNGIVLVQQYARPARREELPEKVPSFFTDMKVSNWGIYEGRPVAVDYGVNLLIDRGLTNAMKAAEWYDEGAATDGP